MQNSEPRAALTWRRCRTYEQAEDFDHVVYLFELEGKAFYWGKAEMSFFGGAKRKRDSDGKQHCGRYGPGYDHLVRAFLMRRGRLYIGSPNGRARRHIRAVERFLIDRYGSTMQGLPQNDPRGVAVEHAGDLPRCVR
jgi:hypothetical protein